MTILCGSLLRELVDTIIDQLPQLPYQSQITGWQDQHASSLITELERMSVADASNQADTTNDRAERESQLSLGESSKGTMSPISMVSDPFGAEQESFRRAVNPLLLPVLHDGLNASERSCDRSSWSDSEVEVEQRGRMVRRRNRIHRRPYRQKRDANNRSGDTTTAVPNLASSPIITTVSSPNNVSDHA